MKEYFVGMGLQEDYMMNNFMNSKLPDIYVRSGKNVIWIQYERNLSL